jgi:hypothetical protein
MQIVLDTCALIAFVNGEAMQPRATRAIWEAQTRATARVPSVAAMEIAQKVAVGRLQLSGDLSPEPAVRPQDSGYREPVLIDLGCEGSRPIFSNRHPSPGKNPSFQQRWCNQVTICSTQSS